MISLKSDRLEELFPQNAPLPDFEFKGVVIDNRQVQAGNLFVAIKGDRFDGHDFISGIEGKAAVAVVVEKRVETPLPQIVVSDTRQALAVLANAWRKQLNPKVIAITGSNGKTTVKEMLGRILSAQESTLMTQGNLNNDIGVPLTLFQLNPDHRFAVVEMGANHAREIQYLLSIAEPDVVYVNNAQSAHVEGFGSLQGVRQAKGEMYRYCSPQALAVFNEDDPATDLWKSFAATQQRLGCSMQHRSDITGQFELSDEGVSLTVQQGDEKQNCQLHVYGQHNAQNALAAVAIAVGCGIKLSIACTSLKYFKGVSGRQQIVSGLNNSRLIDDSYNANPDSLAAAVQVLCSMQGEPWLALGDMAELGDEARQLHVQAAKQARAAGVQKFFALGEMSCVSAKEFGDSGYCFSQHDEMARFIAKRLTSGVNLLIKGSRSAAMEKLVSALTMKVSGNGNTNGACHAV